MEEHIKDCPDGQFNRMLLQQNSETARLRHSIVPGLNVSRCPVTSRNTLKDYPQHVLSPPRFVYVAQCHVNSIDNCFKRTKLNEIYTKNLMYLRTKCQELMKDEKKCAKMQQSDMYHSAVIRLSKQMDSKPDPYFYGNYDYYYTGGNLCSIGKEGHVVHVDGENLNNLNVSMYSDLDDESDFKTISSHAFEFGSEIFEVLGICNPNAEISFAARQRNSLSLCSLQSEGSMQIVTDFKTNGAPFISFAQSKAYPNNFLVSTMRQFIRWYDLERGGCFQRKVFDLKSGDERPVCWNAVRPWDDQNYFYVNEQKFHVIDLRVPADDWLKSSYKKPNSESPCDVITSLTASSFSNLLYLGTKHKLHCIDVRSLKGDFLSESATVCRWTHQMDYPPIFMNIQHCENSEIVAMSSPIGGEVRLIELCQNGDVKMEGMDVCTPTYHSDALPYQPPTLKETYESARLRGMCLNPDADLKNRLSCCTTGLSFHVNGDHRQRLLMSTSNGDVFASNVLQKSLQVSDERTNKFNDELMGKYADKLFQLLQPPLNYTEVADMKTIEKVFRLSNLDSTLEDETSSEPVREHLNTKKSYTGSRSFGRWQKSIPSLHKCKDALAQDFLSIWDIECSDDKDITLSQLENTKTESIPYVDTWLESNFVDPLANSVDSLSTTLNTTEEYPNSVKLSQSQIEIPSQSELNETKITQNITQSQNITKTKKIKKKTKYVKGF